MKKTIVFLLLILLFSCPSIQAEMSMRITSRNVQSAEKIVATNSKEVVETIKATEVTGAVETAEPKGLEETTTAIGEKKVVLPAETKVVVEAEEIEEEAETMEEKEVVAPAKVIAPIVVTETKVVVEEIEAEETVEVIGKKEVVAPAEVIEPIVTVEVKVVEEAEEAKKLAGATEPTRAKEIVGSAEVLVPTVAKETKVVVETKEIEGVVEAKKAVAVSVEKKSKKTIEREAAGAVDYKDLGLRSLELNPDEYPDKVIALLEPHKDNKDNDSVLFYNSLGLAYKSKGRFEDAIAVYKNALELVANVPVPSIQYNLGIAYYYNSELPESLNCFLNSSTQRVDHPGTIKWIEHLAGELDVFNVPDTTELKLVSKQKISVNRKKDDRESRVRVYLTRDGGRIQELSVKDKIYAYGIDSDTERPVDYIIIDDDGDGNFDNVINTKGKFGVPTWAYNPE